MTAPATRRLGSRFPCCGVACRHDLDFGTDRVVACPACGKQWSARLIECAPYVVQMAGRPVAKVRFQPVLSRVAT